MVAAAALLSRLRPTLSPAGAFLLALSLFVPTLLLSRQTRGSINDGAGPVLFLLLPYLAAAALHAVHNPVAQAWRVSFALLAAFAIADQAPYLLIPVAVELTVALLCRRPRLLQIGLFAAAGILWQSRLVLAGYFGMPRRFAAQTSGSHPNLRDLVPLFCLAAAALLFYFSQRYRRRSPLTLVLLAAGAAGTAACLLTPFAGPQQQALPLTLFALALALTILDFYGRHYRLPSTRSVHGHYLAEFDLFELPPSSGPDSRTIS